MTVPRNPDTDGVTAISEDAALNETTAGAEALIR